MRTDGELIEAYARGGEESAFAELASRHGGMVYRVCLRIVSDRHEAEDAAQAVFICLARKARSLRRNANLAAWLHGVARNVSLRCVEARRNRARREEKAAMMRAKNQGEAGTDRLPELDRAMASLPVAHRQAVVLRYLENRSEKESAEIAGCPQGTLGRRASEGLSRMRSWFARRGTVLEVAGLAAALEAGAATAIPETLLPSLAAASKLTATGAATAGGSNALLLAEGTMKAMTLVKIKIAAAVICAATVLGGGGTIAVQQLSAGEPAGSKAATPKPNPADTALAKACAALKPGQSAKFPTPDLKKATSIGGAWGYQTRWFYDAPRRCAWLLLDGQNTMTMEVWFYDEVPDKWTKLYHGPASKETTGNSLGHVWDMHMLAPDGTLYFTAYGLKKDADGKKLRGYPILRFDRKAKGPQGTGNWVHAIQFGKNLKGGLSTQQHGPAWHPNLYGKGKAGIVFCESGQIRAAPVTDPANVTVVTKRAGSGDNTTSIYVPGMDAVICGGGNNSKKAHALHMIRPGPKGPVATELPSFDIRKFHPDSPSTKLGSHNAGGPVVSKLVVHPNGKTALILEDSCSKTRRGSWWMLTEKAKGKWEWTLAGTHPFRSDRSGGSWKCSGALGTLSPSYGCLMYGDQYNSTRAKPPFMTLWKVPDKPNPVPASKSSRPSTR
jgi:RNA polymerase sigma factor (sigma-70 family)